MSELNFLNFEADFSAPRIVGGYDELPLWSSLFGLLLLEEIPLRNITAALDVGCGTGFPLIELAERLGSGCHVHGIDPWSAGLTRAREKVSNRELSNVTIHEGSASAMPFADGTFDLVVSNLGLNNFDDRARAIRECRRVARTGASLALTTNLQGHMAEFYAVFDQVLRAAGDEAALGLLRQHIEHRSTLAEIRELLGSGGFTVSRIVERQGSMRFADGTALLNHHFIKLGFLDGWKSVVLNSTRETFTRLRQALNETAATRGELRLTIPMAYVEATAR